MRNIIADKLYANISNDYNPQTKYVVDEYCYYDGIVKKCIEAVADYNETAAYAIGDYCYHEEGGVNNLYKCNTVIAAPGETWTAAHWDLTTELPTGKWITTVITNELGGAAPTTVDWSPVAAAYDETATYNVGDFCVYNSKLYRCIFKIATAEIFDATHWTQTSAITTENEGAGYIIRDAQTLAAVLNGTSGATGKIVVRTASPLEYTGELSVPLNTTFVGDRSARTVQDIKIKMLYKSTSQTTYAFKGCKFYNVNITISIDSSSPNYTAASYFTMFESCMFENSQITLQIGDKFVPTTKHRNNRMSGFKSCQFLNTNVNSYVTITDPALYNCDYITMFDTCKDIRNCSMYVTFDLTGVASTFRASSSIDLAGIISGNTFNSSASGSGVPCIFAGYTFLANSFGCQVTGNNFIMQTGYNLFTGNSVAVADFGYGTVTGNHFNFGVEKASVRIGRGCIFTGNNVINATAARKMLVLTIGTNLATNITRTLNPYVINVSNNELILTVPETASLVAGDCVAIDATELTSDYNAGMLINNNTIRAGVKTDAAAANVYYAISKLADVTKFVANNNVIIDRVESAVTAVVNNSAFHNADNASFNVIDGFTIPFVDDAGHTPTGIFNNIIS